MSETKKPTDDKAKTTTKEELSEEQLEQVAGGAVVTADGTKGGMKFEVSIGTTFKTPV